MKRQLRASVEHFVTVEKARRRPDLERLAWGDAKGFSWITRAPYRHNSGENDSVVSGRPAPYSSQLAAMSYLDHFCSCASNEAAINWNAPLVYASATLQSLNPPAVHP